MRSFKAESSNATQPAALGDAMEVPFMSCVRCNVYGGTHVIAPPGAAMHTPKEPSIAGPRDVQLKGVVGRDMAGVGAGVEDATRSECCTRAISGVT